MSFLERKNTKDGMAAGQKASVDNIYALDGKVPVLNAIPFGLQHILAMFVANIAPILIVAGACGMDAKNTAMIIQSAMMIAGIGTLHSVIPNLENRFETSDCHGNFLYLCIHCLCHWRTVWLWSNHGSGSCWRYRRRCPWTFVQILDEAGNADCCSNRCNSNWIFPA